MASRKIIKTPNGKAMLPARKVAARLRCAPDYVGKLCREGKLRGRLIDQAWYVDAASVASFEAARQAAKFARSQELSALRRQELSGYDATQEFPAQKSSDLLSEPSVSREGSAGQTFAPGTPASLEDIAPSFEEAPVLHTPARPRAMRVSARALPLSLGALAPLAKVAAACAAAGLIVAGASALTSVVAQPSPRSELAASLAQVQSPFFGAQAAPTSGFSFGGWLASLFASKPAVTQSPLAQAPAQPSAFPQSVATTTPAQVATPAPTAPARIAQSAPSTVNTYPVTERVVEKLVSGAVSENELTQKLQELTNALTSKIYSISSQTTGQAIVQYAPSQRIDNLSGVTISSATITGSSVGGYVAAGQALAVTDTATSTFANGIALTGGCFSVKGTCISPGATDLSAATGVLAIAHGGTGTTTAPTYGKLLVGNAQGGYDLLATSSLGITGGGSSNLAGLTDVTLTSQTFGDVLQYNGTKWINVATSSLGIIGGSFSTTSATYFVDASSTIPKTYSNNTFTGGNIFANSTTTNATTTTLFATTASSTNLFAANASFGTLSVSAGATSTFGGVSSAGLAISGGSVTLSSFGNCTLKTDALGRLTCGTDLQGTGSANDWVFFNGSGERLATTTNQLLVGASATTSLATLDVVGINGSPAAYFSGNVGIGTTSPYAALSVVGQIVGAYFTGTTTATSTFAGGLNVTGGCLAVNGVCVGGGGGGSSTLAGLTDVTLTSPIFGNLLEYNGTKWVNVATSSLGISSGGSFSGGTLTAANVVGTSTATSTFVGGINLATGAGCLAVNGTCISTGNLTNYWTFSGSTLYNNSGTNVGINTSSPGYALDVAGYANTSLGYKIAGATILYASSTNFSTLVGSGAGASLTGSGTHNTAVGYQALNAATTPTDLTAVGYNALSSNVTGANNTALGSSALTANVSGASNTAVGSQSLASNVTGANNTALGYQALNGNTTGSRNSAFGALSLAGAGAASDNVAFGYNALNANTSGSQNVAVGSGALSLNTTGLSNVGVSYNALNANTTGNYNVAFGANALAANSTGSYNIAIGASALAANNGDENIALGHSALAANTNGTENAAFGSNALLANTTGFQNVAFGYNTLATNISGTGDTALGFAALRFNGSATSSVAIGFQAGYGVSGQSASQNNVFLGYQAGFGDTTGNNNTLVGYKAGSNITTGAGNIVLGYNLGAPSATGNNQLTLGNLLYGTNLDGTGTTYSTGQLGVGSSTPYARFAVQANNGDVNTTLFAVGSSTASATTTLFTILNTGLVGIGTTSPFAPLSVSGNGYFAGNVTASNLIATGTISFAGIGDNVILSSNSNGFVVGTSTPSAANYLATSTTATSTFAGGLSVAGTAGLTVLQSGRVGIGTTSPMTAFVVDGTDAIKIPVGNSAQRPSANQVGQIRYNTTTHQFEGFSDSSVWQGLGGVIDVSGDTYIIAESSPGADDNTLHFYTGGAQRMIIASTGNLGLGTTSPYARLSVAGTDTATPLFVADALSGFAGKLLDLKVASTTKLSVNQNGDLLVMGSTTLQNFTALNATTSQATTTNLFATVASSTNLFATTAVLNTLLLTSSTTLQNLTFLNATGTAATTTNLFTTTASTTNLFASNVSGGIGTFSGTLGVTGLTTLVNASTTQIGSTNAAFFGTAFGSHTLVGTSTANAWGAKLGISTSASLIGTVPLLSVTADNASQLFDVQANGFVGLGVATAGYLLDIHNQNGQSQLHVTGTDADSGAYLTSASTNGATLSGGSQFDGTFWYAKDTSASQLDLSQGAATIYTNTGLTANTAFTRTARFTVASGGNVGVGTTSPGLRFSVAGDTYLGGNLIATGTATTTNLYVSNNVTGAGLTSCSDVMSKLLWANGTFSCGVDAGAGANENNWLYFNGSGVRTGTTTNTVLIGDAATTTNGLLEVAGGNIMQRAFGNPGLAAQSAGADLAYQTAIAGNYAYLAENANGLRIVDIRNPNSPVTVGTFSLSTALSVAVAGKYAYVGDTTTGLNVIDVSNPSAPVRVGNYSFPGLTFSVAANGLAVSGRYVYMTDYNNPALRILDVSDPAHPRLVGSYAIASGAPYTVAVQGKYAYVGDQGTGKIYILDVSDPANPAKVGTYTATGIVPMGTYVSGRYLYVADNVKGFYIVNISNPASPALVGQYKPDASDSYYGLSVAGNYAYVADNGHGKALVIDISNPSSPALIGSYTVASGAPMSVALSGKYAYVADYTGGLQLIDINGEKTPALSAGALAADQLNVADNGAFGGDVGVGGGLDVGISGIFSRGTIAAYIASSTAVNPTVASFIGGNVGLGTTSPYARLTIAAGPAADANTQTMLFAIASSTSSYATTTLFSINNAGLTTMQNLLALSSTTLQNFTALNATTSQATTTNLYVSGSLFANASSTIGNGNANGGLTINGNATTTGNLLITKASAPTTGSLYFGAGTANLAYNGSDFMFTGGNIYTAASSIVAQANSSTLGLGARYNAGTGTYWFGATNSATPDATFSNNAGLERMRLTDAGNLGLGSTTPYAKLSVSGFTTGTPGIVADALSGFVGPLLDLKVASTTKFSVNQNGDLLVMGSTTLQNVTALNATTSQATTTVFFATTASSTNLFGSIAQVGTLTVLGNTTHAGTLTQTGLATFVNGLVSQASSTIGNGAQAGGLTINGGATTTGNAYFAGNIGIGTTSPARNFVVSSAASPGQVINFDTSSSFGQLLFSQAGSNAGYLEYIGSSFGTVNRQHTLELGTTGVGTDITFRPADTEAMRLTSGGLLGVGSTSPYAKLSVSGFSSGTPGIVADALSGFAGNILDLKVASTTKFSVNQNGDLLVMGSTTLQNATSSNFFATTASSTNLFAQSGTVGSLTAGNSLSIASLTGPLQAINGAVSASSTLSVFYGGTGVNTFASNGVLFGNGTGALQATAAAANSILVTNGSNVPSFSTTLPAYTLGGAVAGNGQNITGLNNLAAIGLSQLTNASSSLLSVFTKAYFGGTATSTFDSAGNLQVMGSTTLQNVTALNATTSQATTTSLFATTASSTNLFAQTAQLAGPQGLTAIAGTGFVGIGSTTPWAKFGINSSSIGASPAFAVGSSTMTSLLVDNAGRVAIASTSANHTLDINGNLGLGTGGYINWGNTDGTSGYGIRDNAGVIQVKNSGNAWVNIPTSGTTQWVTNPNGNDISFLSAGSATYAYVGIGTTSPGGAALQVASSTGPQLLLTDPSAAVNQKHFFASSTQGSLVWGTLSDSLQTQTPLFMLDGVNKEERPAAALDNGFKIGTSTARISEVNLAGTAGTSSINFWQAVGSNYEKGSLGFVTNSVTGNPTLTLGTSQGGAGQNRDIYIKPAGSGSGLYVGGSGQVGIGYQQFDNSIGNALLINGRLGIGTTSPQSYADVYVNGRNTGDLKYGLRIVNSDAGSQSTGMEFVGGGAAGSTWVVGTDLTSSGVPNFFIATTTKGATNNPTSAIFQITTDGAINLANTSGVVAGNKLYAQGGGLYWDGTQLNGAGITNYLTQSGSTNYLSTWGNNLGVGTSTAGARLAVAGAAGATTPLFMLSTTTAGNATSTAAYFSNNGNLHMMNGTGIAVGYTNTPPSSGAIISGNVGIGTSNPASILTVNDSNTSNSITRPLIINHVAAAAVGDGVGMRFAVQAGNIDVAYIDASNNVSNGGALMFSTRTTGSLTEKMRIDNAGNVGIGTTSPQATLDIGGNIISGALGITTPQAYVSASSNTVTGLLLANPNSGTAAEGRFAISDSGTTTGNYIAVDMPGTGNTGTLFGQTRSNIATLFTQTSSGNGRALAIGTVNNNAMLFGTNNAERMRIDSSGNLGIGTTTPNDVLTVYGGQTFTNSVAFDSTKPGRIYKGSITGLTLVGTTGSSYDFGIYAPTSGTALLENPTATNNLSLVRGGGNVGIGTTTPWAKLSVRGDIETENGGTVYVAGSGSTNLNTTGASFMALSWDGTNNAGVIQPQTTNTAWRNLELNPNGGNVGIGTTTPQSTLAVAGSLSIESLFHNQFTFSPVANGILRFSGNNGSSNNLQMYDGTGSYLMDIYNGSTRAVSINSSGESWLNGGNVGIGTTGPGRKLDVYDSSDWRPLMIETGNTAGPAFVAKSNSAYWALRSTGSGASEGSGKFLLQYSTDDSTYSSRLAVDTAGNVGIGNTGPGHNLEVGSGAIANTTILLRGGNNGGYTGTTITLGGDAGSNSGTEKWFTGIAGTSNDTYTWRAGGASNVASLTSAGALTVASCSGCSSDARLKTNVQNLPGDALSQIAKLRPVSFNWKGDVMGVQMSTTTTQYGFIAQEAQQAFPDLVHIDPTTSDLTPDGTYQFNYQGLIAPMVEAIKELDTRTTSILNGTATSTITNIAYQNASTTNTDTLCIGGDCRSAWPATTTVDLSGFVSTSTLSGYLKTSDFVSGLGAATSSIYALIATLPTTTPDLSIFALKTDIPNVSGFVSTSTLAAALANVSSTTINNIFSTTTNSYFSTTTADLTGYATQNWVNALVASSTSGYSLVASGLASATSSIADLYTRYGNLSATSSLLLGGTLTGNITPNADNTLSLGSASNRFAYIYGAKIMAGDLGFSETQNPTALPAHTFTAGDIVALQVKSTGGSCGSGQSGTCTVPVDLLTAINTGINSSNSLYLNTSGGVGVGVASTSALNAALDVRKASTGDTRLLSLNNTSATGNLQYQAYIGTGGDLTLASNDNSQGTRITNARPVWNVTLGGVSDYFDIGHAASGSGSFTNTSALRITNGGQVGFGTTSPYATLAVAATPNNVNANGQLFAISSSTAAFATSTLFSINNAGLTTAQNFLATASSTLQNFTALQSTSTNATSTNFFATTASSTNLFAQSATLGGLNGLNVPASGNVGIGVASPATKLDVEGSGATLTNIQVGNSQANAVFGISAAGVAHLWTNNAWGLGVGVNGADVTNWASSGNSVTTAFHTGGTFIVNSADASLTDLTVGNNQAVTGLGVSAAGVGHLWTTGAWSLALGTNSAAAMTILNGGNVGIGTSSPVSKLAVDGGALTVTNGDSGNGGRLNLGSVGGSAYWSFITNNNINGLEFLNSSGNTTAAFTQTGNVGIGTTTPQEKLEVVGNGSSWTTIPGIRISDKSGNASSRNWGIYTNGGAWGNLDFYTSAASGGSPNNATQVMSLTSGGNVGIGNTSPSALLHIGNGTQSGEFLKLQAASGAAQGAYIGIHNSAGTLLGLLGQYSVALGSGTSEDISLQAQGARNLTFNTNALERMRIDSSGNVGIGTTNPSGKLQVLESGTDNTNGDAITTGTYITGPNRAFNTAANPTNLTIMSNSTLGADVGGTIGLGGRYTGTSFAQAAIIKGAKENATDGNYASYLAFGTRADGAQITEKMRISSTGNVGIGTASPVAKLDVRGELKVVNTDWVGGSVGSGLNILTGASSGNTYTGITAYTSGAAGAGNLILNGAAGLVGIGTTSPAALFEVGTGSVVFDNYKNCTGFTSNANGLIACTASDQRLKQDITSLSATTTGLAAIEQLAPVSFYWKPETQRGPEQQYGFIAQDVQKIFPNLVTVSNPTTLTPDGTLSLNYNGFVAPMVVSIQQLDQRTVAVASSTAGDLVIGAATVTMTQPATTTIVATDGAWSLATSTATGTTPLIAVSAGTTTVAANAGQATVSINAHVLINGQDMVAAVGEQLLPTSTTGTTSTTYNYTPTDSSYAAKFMAGLKSALAAWFADAGNGIVDLFAAHIHAQIVDADTVNTKTLCIGTTCVTEDQLKQILGNMGNSISNMGSSTQSTTYQSPSTVPQLSVNGTNPTTVAVGASYIDLGATIVAPANDLNLGVYASVDGAATTSQSGVQVDTTVAGVHYVVYSVTDQSGVVGYATRTVIVGDGSGATSPTATSTQSAATTSTTTATSTAASAPSAPASQSTTTTTTATSTPTTATVDTTTVTATSTATSTTP